MFGIYNGLHSLEWSRYLNATDWRLGGAWRRRKKNQEKNCLLWIKKNKRKEDRTIFSHVNNACYWILFYWSYWGDTGQHDHIDFRRGFLCTQICLFHHMPTTWSQIHWILNEAQPTEDGLFCSGHCCHWFPFVRCPFLPPISLSPIIYREKSHSCGRLQSFRRVFCFLLKENQINRGQFPKLLVQVSDWKLDAFPSHASCS